MCEHETHLKEYQSNVLYKIGMISEALWAFQLHGAISELCRWSGAHVYSVLTVERMNSWLGCTLVYTRVLGLTKVTGVQMWNRKYKVKLLWFAKATSHTMSLNQENRHLHCVRGLSNVQKPNTYALLPIHHDVAKTKPSTRTWFSYCDDIIFPSKQINNLSHVCQRVDISYRERGLGREGCGWKKRNPRKENWLAGILVLSIGITKQGHWS